MPRVLIVAYYFPPIGGIGSIRLARFATLLADHGWDATVLAPRSTPHASDPHLEFPEDRVVRSRSLELSQVGRAALGGDQGGGERSPSGFRARVRSGLRHFAHRYVFFPDAQIGWYPGAVRVGRELLRRERFDVVYSSSYPITAHLVARRLSRGARLPWVAEYRDPWSARVLRGHPYRRAGEALERVIARDATSLVMPSPTWAEHYGGLWGRSVDVLPNGHDGGFPERRPPARPVLTHVGSYYPGENDLRPVWEALARMRREGREQLPSLRFVGSVPDGLRVEVESFGLADVLETTGFVPHDEAMRELMSSSMLIASGVAGDDPAQRGWVPAKLFDYVASGLPVLFVGEQETDAAQLVAGHPGCFVVRPGDADGALEAIRSGLAAGDSGRDAQDLSRDARAAQLAEILDRARGGAASR